MNRVTINLDILKQNLSTINRWMKKHGASWTVVTKVLCGHIETVKALKMMGVNSIGDSRLENFAAIRKGIGEFETWYLRVPDLSSIGDVITLSDVSLNSEIDVIKQLNKKAAVQDKIHRVIIMIELGDLREGILPGSLIKFYEEVFHLSNIEVLGIGANLGCLAGVVPSIDQFMQLILYRELLELKFQHKLAMISGGSTAVLPLMVEGTLPKAINHFRIGEAIFLGTDLINGGTLPELRNDVVLLEAEIAEIKEKNLATAAETGTSTPTPFAPEEDEEISPGQRGYRALVSVGQLDTDVSGLTPIDPDHRIAGASSDIVVVNLGDNPDNLKVGDTIKFKCNYSALLRLMSGRYLEKVLIPSLDEFEKKLSTETKSEVEPVLDEIE
ncbi:MAG: alanine/ornithine racemase family PLP-dependent enzyme [candidate division Zixibacteria bacterium]|nr:alanine/ornithine racemase family PLP-dependent enzyme [candidate division Zixibacteria bacterium]